MTKAHIKELEKAVRKGMGDFPLRINFILARKDGKNQIIFNKVINTKTKIENIKYRTLQTISFSYDGMVSLGAKDIDNIEQLDDELERYSEIWEDSK